MNGIQIDLKNTRRYSIKERKNIVNSELFARPYANGTFSEFLESLPKILAANDLKKIAKAIVHAHQNNKPVILAMGGHVIKCGLSPLIINLMKKRVITGLALNGAASIHDFEIALIGETSEDVGCNIQDGTFGFAEETGQKMNEAINRGVENDLGMGESLGKNLMEIDAPFNDYSVLATGAMLDIPVTVHVAIGTDIIHQHPSADGGALGKGSYKDFLTLTSHIASLGSGGVFLNFGSAVILPEVFLKCISIARNLGNDVTDFTTANFDFIQHYRPTQNIVKRPLDDMSKGYAITGHHEIMLPLLYRAILEYL